MAQPLLVIEVTDLHSVPIIRYKGEEIEGMVSVSYDWTTRTEVEGKHELTVNYCGKDSSGYPIVETITEERE